MQFPPSFWCFIGLGTDHLRQVPRGHNSSVWCCLGEPALPLDNFLGNLQFPLLPHWEVFGHTELICTSPICVFNLFIRHLEPHSSLKKHTLRDAGKLRLHTVLRANRAGNCPTESRGAAFLQLEEVGEEGRRWKSRRKRKILESATVIQPKCCSRTEGALKVASF